MYKSIVAPVDVSVVPMSERILSKALFHLQHSNSVVHLIAVAPANASEEDTDKLSIDLMGFAASHIAAHEGDEDRIHLVVKKGTPADVILSYSKEVDANLIILGRHRSHENLLGRPALGTTTLKVSSQCEADICIIKHTD